MTMITNKEKIMKGFVIVSLLIVSLVSLILFEPVIGVSLILRDPLQLSISSQVNGEGDLNSYYNISGFRPGISQLPRYWFLKTQTQLSLDENDVRPDFALQVMSTNPSGDMLVNLERSSQLTRESMRRGTTEVYSPCTSPITNARNFTIHISYIANVRGCDCSIIAGLNTEVLFSDGSSDTTYSMALTETGGNVEGDYEFTSRLTSVPLGTKVEVSAWPRPDDSLGSIDLSNKILTVCLVPACQCGSFTVKELIVET